MALLLSLTLTAAGCNAGPDPDPEPSGGDSPSPAAKPAQLTFGVFGSQPEIEAYRQMARDYNAEAVGAQVELVTWPDRDAMLADVEAGVELPDLYMLSRRDLATVGDEELNTPLLELLDERGISYGDGFAREAIEAFSADSDLQCMPYDSSPMVIYYNTDLIDFDRMRERELPAPAEDETSWNFEEFTAAAQFATRPRKKTRGVSIEPTLSSLAPFIYAGGGQVFNDDDEPTSLAFNEDDSREALLTALALLRNPQVTLTDQQLANATPEEWFKRGRLGMIEGFRNLTPELRATPGLNFDVMRMPGISEQATVGDMTGLCISSASENVPQTADFLVHAISEEAFEKVASSGYIVPTNREVSRSEAFLQPDLMPAHTDVFNASLRYLRLFPLLDSWEELSAAVRPTLRQLLTTPVINELEELTQQIDEESQAVLDPDYVAETPSESPSEPSSESSTP